MRVGGLASGIDTETMIEQLMSIERRPLILMQQKQVELEAQKNAWRDINTRLSHLADKFLSLKLESTYISRVAEASQAGIVTAKANPSAVEASYQINVKRLATAAVRYTQAKVDDVDAALGSGSLALHDQGGNLIIEITIDEDESLRDLVKRLNEMKLGDDDDSPALPIKASIVDNRLVLTSKETGEANAFDATINGTTLSDGGGGFIPVAGSGQDAELEVNGIAIKSSSNKLQDVIQGVTLDLVAVGETTLNIGQDTQQVIDKLQEFVDQYNSVLDFINDKLQAKSEMDPNSKRGTLSGDTTLMRLQSRLRSIVAGGSGGEGALRSLADIGIGTAKFVKGAADYSGKITLDKDKLEAVLKEDPIAVKELLFKVTEELDENGETVAKDSGIFYNLESYVRDFTRAGDGILTEKDKSYDKQINDLKQQVEKMEYRLELRRERLVSQFVALEKALSTMQSQGNWLTTQLSQLNSMVNQPRNK